MKCQFTAATYAMRRDTTTAAQQILLTQQITSSEQQFHGNSTRACQVSACMHEALRSTSAVVLHCMA
eukprot:18698-Heterococcus_DN1.PRE.1